jgi:hypothetical protein
MIAPNDTVPYFVELFGYSFGFESTLTWRWRLVSVLNIGDQNVVDCCL